MCNTATLFAHEHLKMKILMKMLFRCICVGCYLPSCFSMKLCCGVSWCWSTLADIVTECFYGSQNDLRVAIIVAVNLYTRNIIYYIYNNYFLQFEMRWYMYGSLKLFWLWTNPVSIWYAMKYLNFYSKLVLIWSVSTVCLFTSKLKRRKLYWSKQDFWRNFSIFMNKLLKN
jgi:hypothetical protein